MKILLFGKNGQVAKVINRAHGLGIYTLIATAFAWAGYAWFQKTRKGFADVL